MLTCFALTLFDYTGYIYLVVATTASVLWLLLCLKGFKTDNDTLWARKMFRFSLVVVMALSAVLSIPALWAKKNKLLYIQLTHYFLKESSVKKKHFFILKVIGCLCVFGLNAIPGSLSATAVAPAPLQNYCPVVVVNHTKIDSSQVYVIATALDENGIPCFLFLIFNCLRNLWKR